MMLTRGVGSRQAMHGLGQAAAWHQRMVHHGLWGPLPCPAGVCVCVCVGGGGGGKMAPTRARSALGAWIGQAHSCRGAGGGWWWCAPKSHNAIVGDTHCGMLCAMPRVLKGGVI